MSPLIWCAAGLLLILVEFALSGFILVFFGIAAMVVGAVVFFAPLPLEWQLILWAALSVALVLGLRKIFKRIFLGDVRKDKIPQEEMDCAGENARVAEYDEKSRCGKVTFHGALWNASFETPHSVGETVVVVRRKNITLIIR